VEEKQKKDKKIITIRLKKSEPKIILDYPISNSIIMKIPYHVRVLAGNILFEENDEGDSITSVILESLLKCPQDIRAEISQNILLCGGTTMIQGFKTRLLKSLKSISDPRYSELHGLKNGFNLLRHTHQPLILGWIGGSIIGSLPESSLSASSSLYSAGLTPVATPITNPSTPVTQYSNVSGVQPTTPLSSAMRPRPSTTTPLS